MNAVQTSEHQILPSISRPATRGFLIAVLLGLVVLVSGMMTLFYVPVGNTQYAVTAQFLTFHAGFDSWGPMSAAENYMVSKPTKLLYDYELFDQKAKFQYPPTALLLLQLLRLPGLQAFQDGVGISFTDILNAANWYFTVVVFIISIRLFLLSQRRYLPVIGAALRGWRSWIDTVVLILLCLLFYPLLKGDVLGQIQVWIDALFALSAMAWLTGHKRVAGVLLAPVCLVKPQYGLILLWGVVRRQWGFVASAAIVLAVGLALSISVYGFDNHLNYLKALSFIGQHGEGFFANNSVNGLLNRLLFNGNNESWSIEFAPFNPVVYGGTLITSALFILTALVLPRKSGAGILDFFIIALSSTMASPIAWEHHYGILLPIFMFVIPLLLARKPLGRLTYLVLGVSYVLCSSYLPVLNYLAQTRWNFLQSYLFFGALILLVLLHWAAVHEPVSVPSVAVDAPVVPVSAKKDSKRETGVVDRNPLRWP